MMNKTTQPYKGYNTIGRGYPDVSALAANYIIMVNGNLSVVYGTSASSPVVASMVSLVNAARLSIGKSSLGWINPSLYALYSQFILNDIISGENNCAADGIICCSQGFYAVDGWDPASGLGSINFTAFKETFLALGSSINNPTLAPTVTAGSPTLYPVFQPTVKPTITPTVVPTFSPGWATLTTYNSLGCKNSSDIIITGGIITGKCIIEYNSTNQPDGSMKYHCEDGKFNIS
jgi:hypothetical protein